MGSTFFGLNIGKSGLYAYQAALDTTAHNIANGETNGYSRQILGMKAGNALRVNSAYGMAGTGVNVDGVYQMRDTYYDIKFRTNNTIFGEYASKSHYMTELENYFNEISVAGFTSAYGSLNESLQELSKNPASLTVRTQVTNYAESLTEYFQSIATNLISTQEECNFEIGNTVDKINSFGQQIASLTKQINTLEIRGGTANDLRDQRNLLIDELSELVSVDVIENRAKEMDELTTYYVKIDNQLLVDGITSNRLVAVPREHKVNQNDAKGLYDIQWSNGQRFNANSLTLGGSLKALFEVRDGNNGENFNGKVASATTVPNVLLSDGTTKDITFVTINEANINEVEKLNIAPEGVLTIYNKTYKYTGFQVEIQGDGSYQYTFELEDVVNSPEIDNFSGQPASISKGIKYKGIPYYMAQMNQLLRTYAKEFNLIHKDGRNLDNEAASDFFTCTNIVSGRNYSFSPTKDDPDYATYNYNIFNSGTGSYYKSVADDEALYGSYYFLTASNFAVNEELSRDPSKLAAASDVENGIENNDIVERLLALKNERIFIQGTTEGFFQTFVAEIGVDTKKASNFATAQENIKKAIDNQRLSISGVDIDEEAMNLVRYQNAYNMSAKVISVMDEIYNKLINEMGV